MRRPLLVAGAVLALAGCRADAPDPENEVPAQPTPSQAPAEPDVGLYTAWEKVFDLPLPAGVTMEAWDVHLQHYRSRAAWDDLLAFFDRELEPGYRIAWYEHGVRIDPANPNGRAIYLYEERHGEGVMLTYAHDPLAEGATTRPALEDGERPPTLAEMIAEGVPEDQVRQTVTPPQRSYTELLESRFGEATDGRSEDDGPRPIGVRLHNERRPESLRRPDGSAAPITFVRGVREERRNPDALF